MNDAAPGSAGILLKTCVKRHMYLTYNSQTGVQQTVITLGALDKFTVSPKSTVAKNISCFKCYR